MDVLAGRHARACFCTSHVLLDTSRETHAWVCDRPMGGEAHSRNTKQQTTQQIDCVAIANHANMHLKLVFLTPACLVYGSTSSGVGSLHVRSSTVFSGNNLILEIGLQKLLHRIIWWRRMARTQDTNQTNISSSVLGSDHSGPNQTC